MKKPSMKAEFYVYVSGMDKTDLNPIEKFWANMKRWVKNKLNDMNK